MSKVYGIPVTAPGKGGGADGKSAYEIAVAEGFEGSLSQWLQSLHGTSVGCNLLDNSDFRNVVNQRGQASYTGNLFTIDRWSIWSASADCTLTVHNGYISLYGGPSGGSISQRLELGVLDSGKTYTAAYQTRDGAVTVFSPVIAYGRDGICDLVDFLYVWAGETLDLVWAALYEGEYTAETLPRYQPKGYGAELMECKRYLQVYKPQTISGQNLHAPIGMGLANGANLMEFDIPLSVPLRKGVLPSLLHRGDFSAWNGTDALIPTDFGVGSISDAVLRVNCQVTGAEIGRPYSLAVLNTDMDGYFMINAEL